MKTKRNIIIALICSNVICIGYIFYVRNKHNEERIIRSRMKMISDLSANKHLKLNRQKQYKEAISALNNYEEALPPIFLDSTIKRSDLIQGLKYILTIQFLDESKSVASIKCQSKEKDLVIESLVEPERISYSYESDFSEHRFMIPFFLTSSIDNVKDEYWKEHYLKLDDSELEILLEEGNCDLELYDIKGNLLDKIEVLVLLNKSPDDKVE